MSRSTFCRDNHRCSIETQLISSARRLPKKVFILLGKYLKNIGRFACSLLKSLESEVSTLNFFIGTGKVPNAAKEFKLPRAAMAPEALAPVHPPLNVFYS